MENANANTIELRRQHELKRINDEYAKWTALSKIKSGSIVKLTDGSIATLIKLKQKNFDGLINGKSFSIPVMMFVELLEEAKDNLGYTKLKKGEAFYITTNNKDALLFIYECMEKGNIIGINPVNNGRTRIVPSLYKGSLNDLLKK